MIEKPEPNLIRLYLRHCAIGFALSAVFVGLILWFDVGHLASLIGGSDIALMAVFLLWFFHGTVFGSVQFAIMVMLNTDKNDDDDNRGAGVPVAVRVQAHR
ncbi:hypothetical protein [Yoonia sp.]|uniref:hypothetical protein n=1 Tax=Yoonia sp. TaxID=2212373 RepID=UPI0019EC36BB|nr:hypothetical protein [Yoonia sp.]MBE0412636.1 hypothetical protein [Yoonia sp.]